MEEEYERKFVFSIIYLVNGDDVIGSHSQQTHIRRPNAKTNKNSLCESNVATLIYTSQHLKWIKTFHQSCPKTKMRSRLRTTLINFFDPLQMLTTVYIYTVGTESIQTPLNFSLFVILQPFAKII